MAKRSHFDRIDSAVFAVETWNRKTYGALVGPVTKPVARNKNGTFRPSTNRAPEVGLPGSSRR